MRGLAAAAAFLGLLACVAFAVPVKYDESNCWPSFNLYWQPRYYGPIPICNGGYVRFYWDQPQGVFQIPDSKCPSNFTAWSTDDYRELSPIGLSGDFKWEVPRNAGAYWVTSPQPNQCKQGMLAHVLVIGDPPPEENSAGRAALSLAGAAALGGTLVALL